MSSDESFLSTFPPVRLSSARDPYLLRSGPADAAGAGSALGSSSAAVCSMGTSFLPPSESLKPPSSSDASSTISSDDFLSTFTSSMATPYRAATSYAAAPSSFTLLSLLTSSCPAAPLGASMGTSFFALSSDSWNPESSDDVDSFNISSDDDFFLPTFSSFISMLAATAPYFAITSSPAPFFSFSSSSFFAGSMGTSFLSSSDS
mmetsp:Transcript_3866/g.9461  ORF Transcript_3866/g.9461 Transcript_3866/m.9461 type:complete len:204 (+) Transcript_3866:112-723(+)